MRILILTILIIGALSKLEFVSEVCRHGARAPGVIYDFAKNPKDNFKVPMQLSDIGVQQHFKIGQDFRTKYINTEMLISNLYNSKEINLRSTDYDRTYDSGLSQAFGIFPPEVCQQKLNTFQQKNALPPMHIADAEAIIKELQDQALPDCSNVIPIYSEKLDKTYDLEINNVYCPPYQAVVNKLAASSAYKKMFKDANDPMKARFKQFLSRDVSYDELWDLCEYLTLADLHKIQLIFNYTADDVQKCKIIHDVKYYIIGYGDEKLWYYSSKVYLDNLITSMDAIVAGNETFKAELNFAHDNTLSYLLNGLGNLTTFTPDLASHLFIELHNINGKFVVRTYFNEKQLTFGLCTTLDCPYETFKKNAKTRVAPGTIYDACGYPTETFESPNNAFSAILPHSLEEVESSI